MPRFVLLYHDCPPDYARPSHWDFMLESGDVLRTWALEELPPAWEPARARTVDCYPHCAELGADIDTAALELGEHRRHYLEFEGMLSVARGRVIRVASGTYATIADSPTNWQFSLSETDISGRYRLSRSAPDGSEWRLAVC
jgi:hypothetical protein